MGRRVLLMRARGPGATRPPGGALAALLTGVAALASGCVADSRPAGGGATSGHVDLACAACHDGPVTDRTTAFVPPETCEAAGCHRDAMPGQVTLAAVRFPHAEHSAHDSLAIGCAGCHTHASGDEPLTAGPETCGLCHQAETSSGGGEGCRRCHRNASHEAVTDQGVAVPHAGLPWIEGGCLRCHYEVARPLRAVPPTPCAACHDDVEGATRRGIGRDPHPSHTSVRCTACHEADTHHVEAMSSAVELVCADCHTPEPGAPEAHGWLEPASCPACHEGVHAAPQRLLLGVAPGNGAALPSPHFMDGLTCRSCHRPAPSPGAPTPTPDGASCVECHRREYRSVLAWWTDGVRARTAAVERYLEDADPTARGGESPSTAASVRAAAARAEARAFLDLVREGGGVHNPPLAHHLLEAASERAAEARRLTGGAAAPAPFLGRAPRRGLCVTCHYRRPDEPGVTEAMDDVFHREVMGR